MSARLSHPDCMITLYNQEERAGRAARDLMVRSSNMWWQDLLWGVWNGLTAWIVLVVHVFGGWEEMRIFDSSRSATGNWYDFGFLLGTGSPFLGFLRRK